MMGSSYEERRLDSSICCLIDSGDRCRRQAGRSSIPSGLHKLIQKRNLRLEIDKKMTHAYICSYHAEMISKKPNGPGNSASGKQQRSNGSSHNGNSVGGVVGGAGGSNNPSAGSLKWIQSGTVKPGNSKLRGTPQSIHYDDISDADDDSDSELVGGGSRKMVHSRRVQIQPGVRHRDVGHASLRGVVTSGKKVSLAGSKTSAGSTGSPSGSGATLALNLLLPKSIKKCRKFFKISVMQTQHKAQFNEILHQHIREMKVSEKDVVQRFIMKVNQRRNSITENDYN